MAQAKTPPPTYAPRPSISPLSTASKANKQSPIATRDAMMQDADLQQDVERNAAAATGEALTFGDDDGSSELSDPDDDLEDDLHGNGINGDISDEEPPNAQKSLEVDSEAETERLDQTPHRQGKQTDGLGKTPSKLSQAAAAEDELSDPPSPLPAGPGAASSTSTVATAGQKRKRSGSDDSSLTSADSELAESPRKRSHGPQESMGEATQQPSEEMEQAEGDAGLSADTPLPDEVATAAVVPRKGPKGKKGRQKGKQKEPIEEAEPEQAEELGDQEPEAAEEDPAKKEEALKAKKHAMEVFESVAKQHKAFQELLNRERLADVARQLDMLDQKECIHPEYLRQVACVDARLQKQQSEARAYYRYKLRCIRERTLGERSQLHSQYFQAARDLREDALEKLGESAYAIQNQRRLESIVPENDDAYVFKYNPKKSVQIRQQAKYNQEVSVLSGMAKYVGFPAAPEIHGAEGSAAEDDLKAMKISKRTSQSAPHRQVYIPPANNSTIAQNERLAHEQFIERNAWAQPQGPLHTLNTPNISHTPDWADQPFTGSGGAAKHLIRNLSGQIPGGQRTGSPYATPLPQKRTPMDFSSSGTVAMGNSDGPENPPSSVLAAPPTSQRISLLNDQPSTSGPQTSPLTVPKHRHTHHHASSNGRPSPAAPDRERELTGFRNISNSTIDAPPSSDPAQPQEVPLGPHAHLYAHNREIHPGQHHLQHHLPHHWLRQEDSAPLQAFDTSAFHRHGEPHGPNGTPLRAGGVVSGLGHRGESRTQTPASMERRREGYPLVAGFRPQEGGLFGTAAPGGSGAIGPGPS